MTNTPHSRALEERALLAAEKAYNLRIEHRAMKFAVAAYLQTLLNDPEMVDRVQKSFLRADEEGCQPEMAWKEALRAIMEGA